MEDYCFKPGSEISHLSDRQRSLNTLALVSAHHFTFIRKIPLQRLKIQNRLQTLIAGARQSWTYAIFWEATSDNNYVPTMLDWGSGYYGGEEALFKRIPSSKLVQELRRSDLRRMNDLIGDPDPGEDVTDSEWFFLVSKTHFSFIEYGLPGRAFSSSTAIWATGAQSLAGFNCRHADGARQFGIQTLVCIPLADGVLELGSSSLIFPNSEFDLLDRVRPLFNFKNNICIREIGTDSAASSSISPPIQLGYESESSVGNCPMFQRGDTLSQGDKKAQSDGSSDSDGRYIEVFTQILRRA